MATSAVPDDDALAWAGDEPVVPDALPAAEATRSAEASATRTPSILLVTYGLLGGMYLIYTLGWIITVQRSTTTFADLLSEIMFQFGEFLAIASPAIWFGAIFVLTRRPLIRLLLLVLGLIVVIPWPYILGV